MKQTNLCLLLSELSTRERTKFKEYVFSPYFNKHQRLRRLCEYLLRHAPDFEHPDLDRRQVYTVVYEEKDFKELRFNNLVSDLLQLLYDYLAQRAYDRQPPLKKQLLLTELRERDAAAHVDRTARRFQQLLEQHPFRNYQFFLHQYALHEQLDQFALTQKRRRYDENLQLQNDKLDLYYMANKFRIACDMASRNIVIKAGYECHRLDQLLGEYRGKESQYAQVPALVVYYETLQMLTNTPSEPHYQQLKGRLRSNLALFPPQELRILYNYALNYCIKMINTGHVNYYQEVLELYKILLEQKIIFINGYLTQWTYKNIVTVGIRLREFDWTEQFINQYNEALPTEEKLNAFDYNMAALHYARHNYKEALQQLHNVEFTDASYHLGAKIIQLKSYYELEEEEAFFALIEAFRKYILRHRELSDYRKKANANMLKLAQRIYLLKSSRRTITTQAYRQKRRRIGQLLESLEPLANKDWLEEVFGKM
ncbi:MAG: hypothetical protein AAGG75_24460 [Bacteroidota bacterium]